MAVTTASDTAPARTRLLDAALAVFRAKGYTAATVDDLCAAAGVTKGSFFHHFDSKLDLALRAVDHWNAVTGALFAQAPYQSLPDPRARLLAYIDLRGALIQGELPEYTCLLGTVVQEVFDTQPALRDACNHGIGQHARLLAEDIAQAKARYAPQADWQALDLAYFTQAVIQGAFVLAKAQGGGQVIAHCIAQLRAHVETLLPD